MFFGIANLSALSWINPNTPQQGFKEALMEQKLKVMLVCGAGASSGFMAANIRKAAAARGLDYSVIARSESEIENYIDEIDVLMVGPHLSYILDEVENWVGDANIPVLLMRPDYYSMLDGDAALDHLLTMINAGGAS